MHFSAKQDDEVESTYGTFDKYREFHVNSPIGPVDGETLPFEVERTH